MVLGLSDAGAHASQLCDACFSTYLLGHWVPGRGTLTLEQAVRMLTSRVAEVVGITDRGRLTPGLAADVTVFDPAAVGCSPPRRMHDLPGGNDRLVADAFGIRAVVTNGTVIREDGRDALTPGAALPGRLLREGCAAWPWCDEEVWGCGRHLLAPRGGSRASQPLPRDSVEHGGELGASVQMRCAITTGLWCRWSGPGRTARVRPCQWTPRRASLRCREGFS